MLEGEEPDNKPMVAQAQLSTHTMLILMGAQVPLIRVPTQWLSTHEGGGPTKWA